MRNDKAEELERVRKNIDEAIEMIKKYGYQDMYKDVMDGNHYGFIAVVDALDILEKSLRG